MTIYLNDSDVSTLLSVDDAIDCVDRGFRLLADGAAINVVRQRTQFEHISVNVMWALAPSLGFLGVKTYPVIRTDVTQGTVLTLLLHSTQTGDLVAVIRADRLGQLRTGAASAVATRELARADSHTMALFGCGFQAETQAIALARTLPELRSIRVVGRSVERRDRFIAKLRQTVNMDVMPAEPREAAESADVIVTATGSENPVLLGEWIAAGTHINATGSNLPSKREIDRLVLERAAIVATDDAAVASAECGDLILNGWDQHTTVALGDVLTGRSAGRTSDDDITLFESHGLALQDVVCGSLVYDRAVRRGIGQPLLERTSQT